MKVIKTNAQNDEGMPGIFISCCFVKFPTRWLDLILYSCLLFILTLWTQWMTREGVIVSNSESNESRVYGTISSLYQ